jgi:SPP1 family predicted phage head-tail adaptor
MIRRNPGKYRRTVQLQAPTAASGTDWGEAGAAATWTTYATVPAEIDPYQSKELRDEKGAYSSTRWTVRIRYRSDVTPDHRIVYGSHTLRIIGVVDIEDRREQLKLDCIE